MAVVQRAKTREWGGPPQPQPSCSPQRAVMEHQKTCTIVSREIGIYTPRYAEGKGGEWSGRLRGEGDKENRHGRRWGELLVSTARQDLGMPTGGYLCLFFFLRLHHDVLLEEKIQFSSLSTAIPYLTLVSVFSSFFHLGHLQTDNMSLQVVLVPWSLSVDKYRVFNTLPLVLRLRTLCTWSFLGGVYDFISSSLSGYCHNSTEKGSDRLNEWTV